MHFHHLPPSLLLFIATTFATETSPQWPYNLPKHQKYWPEHQRLVRRDAQVRQQFPTQQPIAMRKMSDDPSEMFFLDYWRFELPSESQSTATRQDTPDVPQTLDRRRVSLLEESDAFNGTQLSTPYLPAMRLHDAGLSSDTLNSLTRFLARSPDALFKRAFQCPTNTNACTSIGRPNSCCGNTETCQIISDTGIGDVGCCPQGQTCSGSVGQCDTTQGYTSCPGSSNGGCCIPGFSCNGVGCVAGGESSTTTTLEVVTVTGTVTPGNTTVTQTSTPPAPPVSSSPPASLVTATSTITLLPAPAPATPSTTTVYTTLPTSTDTAVVTADTAPTVPASTPLQGTLTCTTGFKSCPASLGGGCCPTDMACGSGGVCPPLSTSSSSATSAAAAPPIRPTSDVPGIITTTTSSSLGFCPTGYYMCSATYIAGCCQVGRNCDTTDCPASTTNTVVSNGVTIVVPGAGMPTTIGSVSANPSQANPEATGTVTSTASVSAAAAGQCATGFYSCAANQGGGCCPSGYGCGSQCTATAAGVGASEVGKADPASGAVRVDADVVRWVGMGMAFVAGGLAVGL